MPGHGGPFQTPPDAGPGEDGLLESKLQRPPRRAEWLDRQRLLVRVQEAGDHPVTLLAAPAGYGKTILLAQWLEQQRPRAAWVSLDPGDNDPNRLWAHVAASLDRVGCPPLPQRSTIPRGGTGSDAPSPALGAILAGLGAATTDVVLVLDDFHFVREAACHHQVEHLIENLPAHVHLVIATRSDPGLRLGRLRASGGLLELRASALGFTLAEARSLLAREEVALDDDAAGLLMQRTEGWPAGLYLASLSLAGRPDPAAFVRDFSGDDRYIGDYLTEEVLSRHPDDVRSFILQVSVLDRFTAALCDHVTGTTGSAQLLRDLTRSNLFVVPLDDQGRWYRFHHLFGAVARSELEVSQPDRLRQVHLRAAEWFRREGHVDEAVTHAIWAGAEELASAMIQAHWLQFPDAGRLQTIIGWLHLIGPPSAGTDPAASVTTAWIAALVGDETTLAERLGALRVYADHGPLPDGSRSVASAIAMIEAVFGYDGPVSMMRGAERAASLETNRHSPFYAVSNVALGHAAYVMGDLDRALTALSEAARTDHSPVMMRALGLATESLVHHERGDLDSSRVRAESAMGLLDGGGLRAVPQASLAYTALGQAQAASGDLDGALATLDQGLQVRRKTSAHGPWGMLHHLVAHAGVAASARQPDLARKLLAELELRMARYGDGMAAMEVRVSAVRRALAVRDDPAPAVEPLTEREVDILRLLGGSLSLHEIAGVLYVSFNTVKTHSRAVYRKLGVHTRADAVVAGRREGLL